MAGPSVTTQPPSPEIVPSRAQRLRHDLRLTTWAWVFGATWAFTINGAAMTQFAKKLGTPDWAFGLIALLPVAGAAFQFPASWFIERYGHRKTLFLIGSTLHRFIWVLIGAVPWILPNIGPLWWMTMLGLLLINWAANAAGGIAWVNWMTDVIPRTVRGRYFGFRNRVGMFMGVLVTIGIGWALDITTRQESANPGLLLKITSAILALAGLIGVLDIQLFTRVRDDYPKRQNPQLDLLHMLKTPLQDKNFRRFLMFQFVFSTAVIFVGQYVWLYVLDVVGLSNMQAQMLIIALPLMVQMIAYPLWGRVMDRVGRKPVLLFCATTAIAGSIGWILLGNDAAQAIAFDGPWYFWPIAAVEHVLFNWSLKSQLGYLAILMMTAVWPGIDVANFNIVMDMAGAKRREGGGGPAYVAVNSIVVALGGICSGLLAVAVAGLIGKSWKLAIPLLGIVLTYHGVLFLLSSVLRALAVLCLVRFHEPRAAGTRQVIELLTNTFYANVKSVSTMPVRVVEQGYRWTYLTSTPIRRRIRFGGKQARRFWSRALREDK